MRLISYLTLLLLVTTGPHSFALAAEPPGGGVSLLQQQPVW